MTDTLPASGTPTFLFTDIEGSTARWESQREAMAAALARHDKLLRSTIETRGGHVFKTVGDAFYAAFADPAGALAAAIDVQRALGAEAWSAFGPDFADLRVRCALHHGKAEARGGDYFGPALNRTARLLSAGHGGQVLLSLAAQQVVRDYLPPGVRLRDWGEHRLKDLRHSEHLFQLLAPDLPDVTTTPVTAKVLSPKDRILVDAEAAARPLPEAMAALLAAVRGEGEVRLTPEQAAEIARHRPADETEYRLGRIAAWSQPRYRLDCRFVDLTLLVDQGEESAAGRWAARTERYESLEALLAAVAEPAVVLLGPPGSGKSTLLRHYELGCAIQEVAGAGDELTFFVQLNSYKAEQPGGSLPSPGDWLAARWRALYPALPPLAELLARGRMTLLLDALNEMPAVDERAFRTQVAGWRDWLLALVTEHPGNRVVFSCRTLDYSAPLSTPALRVPQVQIEALSDEQIEAFLAAYSPVRGADVWQALSGRPERETLRSPYFLALLVEQVEATGELPTDRAGLFTGFVRQALKREVERGGPLFHPDGLLTSRDVRKVVQWSWGSPYELPERGELVPKLGELAHGMQAARGDGAASQVRIGYDEALDLLGSERDEDIVRAGTALSVLEEDPAADEVLYRHQLLQEYFAGRKLARAPEPERVRAAWRAEAIRPGLRELLETLPPAEELPALPQTGWEETTLLAVAMAVKPAAYVRALRETNLALAGRAAGQPAVRSRLDEALLDELRWALVARSRNAEADLRARIAAGLALGPLGDPRFERRIGPHGAYLLPPMVDIPAGVYSIGDDDPIEEFGQVWTDHIPRHEVAIAAFRIGRFPVTNAEWACFLAAGGYEDERWWETADALAWQRGEATAAGIHANVGWQLTQFRAMPEVLDGLYTSGQWSEEIYERYRRRLAMSEAELEAHLVEMYPGGRLREPAFWRDERSDNPSQPVVGICWYEARAYCAWLAAQTGTLYRLPSEVEHEAAQRGKAARRWAFGDEWDAPAANTVETRLKRTSPVGVFVEGDTPEGASDLCGNVLEWTVSLWGRSFDQAAYRYPYDAADGREDETAGPDVLRVARGGTWHYTSNLALAARRDLNTPDDRSYNLGFRLAAPHASRQPAGIAVRREPRGRGRERWRAQAPAGGPRAFRANTEEARAFW
jgi:formylglycine-generating enzyme required for sulfatase activity/class 3 adenylate cyclase